MTAIGRPTADQIKQPDRPRLADVLGPGLVTGASDDDPSGIATYSQAGAQFGYALIWSLLFTYPLMCAIQMISADIGRVTGEGLAANMRRHYSMWLLYPLVGLLIVANVIDLGADLGAMAAAIGLLLPAPRWLYIAIFALVIALMEVFMRYARYVSVLRWLTLSCSLMSRRCSRSACPGRRSRSTLSSRISNGPGAISRFSWPCSAPRSAPTSFSGRRRRRSMTRRRILPPSLFSRGGAGPRQLARIRLDTMVGMGASNVVALFIMLTTAATLHAHGITNIETSSDAAKALQPIAGEFAFVVFALGIVGTGLLAVPVLAGSAAYALGETLQWRVGLAERPGRAPAFYWAIAAAVLVGALLNTARPGQSAVLERRGQWRRRSPDHGHDHTHGLAARRDARSPSSRG